MVWVQKGLRPTVLGLDLELLFDTSIVELDGELSARRRGSRKLPCARIEMEPRWQRLAMRSAHRGERAARHAESAECSWAGSTAAASATMHSAESTSAASATTSATSTDPTTSAATLC